jgi:hypothetical protein
MEYGRICKKKHLTYVCGSDRNIRPSVTRPWAVTRQASLPPNGRATSERRFRSEPQNMTDIISPASIFGTVLYQFKGYQDEKC